MGGACWLFSDISWKHGKRNLRSRQKYTSRYYFCRVTPSTSEFVTYAFLESCKLERYIYFQFFSLFFVLICIFFLFLLRQYANKNIMKAIKTKTGGYGMFFSESEMLTFCLISVNLLGKNGIGFLDDYSNKTVPTLLSSQQIMLLEEMYNQIQLIYEW